MAGLYTCFGMRLMSPRPEAAFDRCENAAISLSFSPEGVMTGRRLRLKLETGAGGAASEVVVERFVIAGWTGRDRAGVEKHIAELAALGVQRPASVPIFYRVAAARLTTDGSIETSGDKSSGEAEFVLLRSGGRLWAGVGSDHTDREVESYGVTVSKQMCDKPIAAEFWDYESVAPHWDRLLLRSTIMENGKQVPYQEGSVAEMLKPAELIAGAGADFGEGTLMFCGTLAVKGGIRPAPRFAFELEDPVRGRKIGHAYDIRSLPILG
jgi:hypothetical protein